MAYRIPTDHVETGTVIQGKPLREPEAADIQPGDLVKVQWPDDWDMPDEWYATYGDTYRVEEIVPSPVAFVRPIGKETILPYIADIEWLSRVEPEPTPPRPMRSFDTRIQTGDIVIIQPFTGHNEIFVVLSANNEKALLHSENNEIKIVDLYKLLRVWPDPESVYGVYCGAIAVEPPKE